MSDLVAGRPGPVAPPAAAPAETGPPRPRGRLFRRYALSFAGLVGMLLLASGVTDAWFSYSEIRATLAAVQQGKAESAAQRIEQFVAEIERQIGWTTHAQWAAGSVDQRRFDYVRLLRQVPAITELVQLDGQGREQLKVSRLAMDVVGGGTDYASDPRFTEAQRARIWYGPVYFRKESEPYMTLAILRAGRGGGVTLAEVNLKLIWDVVTAVRAGRGGYAYVVDRDGRLIAHPDISLVLRNTDLAAAPQVAAARAAGPPSVGDPPRAELVPGFDGSRVFSAWAPIPQLGWTVFVEQPVREAFEPLIGTLVRTIVLLLLGFVVAALAAVLFARRMLSPIRALEVGAARLGAGELDHRIDIRTGDELQALADGFNEMGGRLKESYANLERKVEARTHELSEALERQTATSEVLNVISRSTSQLQPVLDAIVRVAAKLCHAPALVFLERDGFCHIAAAEGARPDFLDYLRHHPIPPAPDTLVGRTALEKRTVYIRDTLNDPSYGWIEAAQLGGYRSNLGVPLMRGDEVVGVIVLIDPNVRGFTEKQVELLESFANQAVIAIENVRLFDEVQARTRDLQESLEYQTATSEVLNLISRSTFDLRAVFEALTATALRLCRADFAWFARRHGDEFRFEAGDVAGPMREIVEKGGKFGFDRGTIVGRSALERRPVQVLDVLVDPEYRLKAETAAVRDGPRTILGVPLMREGDVIGVFALSRRRIEAFDTRQIELVSQFADQAVIAMENVRLFDEVQARTAELQQTIEHQTATNAVLEIISRSPTDALPVFETIVQHAVRLCGSLFANAFRYDGETLHYVTSHDASPAYRDLIRTKYPMRPDASQLSGRVILANSVVTLEDARSDPHYDQRFPEALGWRRMLGVPVQREGKPIGVITVGWAEAGPVPKAQMDLLRTFADQAVIAIENVRLFDEVQARTAELQESLEQQTATNDVLRVISTSPGSLAPVFEAMLESATRICEAEFGIVFRYRDGVFHAEAMRNVPAAFAEDLRRGPDYLRNMGPETAFGQMVARGEPVHIEDMSGGPAYRDRSPVRVAVVELGMARTFLALPMLKDGKLIGAFALYRQEVRRFAPKQVELVAGFASQAVIAIENVRLFDEVQARTRELSESLEQQTATSAVLNVITRSPGELDPVFDSILQNATRICDARFGILFRVREGAIHAESMLNVPPAYAEFLRDHPQTLEEARTTVGRMMSVRAPIQTEDLVEDEAYRARVPLRVAAVELGGVRTSLAVPMLKEDELVGMFVISRGEVRPFTPKQIELASSFASQAAVAIENVRLLNEVQARTRELSESLEYQTATSEVLKAISRSTFDLGAVLDALTEAAKRLCRADWAWFLHHDGDGYRVGAGSLTGPIREVAERAARIGIDRRTIAGRAGLEKRIVHLADALADPEYALKDELGAAGARTLLGVPLLRDGALKGVFALGRQRVEAFTPQQIELVSQFADQAVIAMENVRLFDEVQARTRELSESLEQQTATSEVLRVITNSPGQLEPVFDSILENASQICDAPFGALFRHRDGALHVEAMLNVPPDYAEYLRTHPQPLAEARTGIGRVMATKEPVLIVDAAAEEAYRNRVPLRVAAVELGRIGTFLAVPMLKEDELVGMFVIYRTEVRTFTPKQIELASSFASQAAVAIENVRLLNEVQARTRELQESLEYQTATSDVLKAISRSTFDLGAVLEALTSTAMRLCRADFAWFARRDGDQFRMEAGNLLGPTRAAAEKALSRGADRGSVFGRTVLDRALVHIVDPSADPEYLLKDELQAQGGGTVLGLPLMRDGDLIGVFILGRFRIEAFATPEIDLVSQFADQAVIAMENVRLFEQVQARTRELGQSVEEMRALGEVSQTVNSTLDAPTVLETIVAKAVELSGTEAGAIYVWSKRHQAFRMRASAGGDEALDAAMRKQKLGIDTPLLGDAARRREVVQAPDLREVADTSAGRLLLEAGYRALLVIPLIGPERAIGALVLRRKQPGTFPERTVDLMRTFAAQSVVAIQNARLFGEIEEKGRQLELASQHKSQFLANMSHELRTPLNAVLGYAELMADGVYGDLSEKANGVLARIQSNGRHLLGLINDVLDLSKIEAGQLTLTLDEYTLPGVVQAVISATESLASAKGLKLGAEIAPGLPLGRGDERRLTQVLLNVVGNAIKFTDTGGVTIAAARADGVFEIGVTDTGPGIAPEHQARIFEEFQQVDDSSTRKKGGSGLGLAISRKIVELHGGTIAVRSAPGEGSTFTIRVPVRVEEQKEIA